MQIEPQRDSILNPADKFFGGQKVRLLTHNGVTRVSP
jgi:hypothetical protein